MRGLAGAPSLHPELEDVYDAIETPRARRSDVPILDEAAARRYLDEVRARALEALARADLSDDADPLTARGFVFDLVAQHEAQHTETILQCLQMLPPGRYAPPARRPLPAPAGPAGGWVEIAGGAFAMGAPEGPFAYDCERPVHRREVAPFRIARDPVTCGEHLAFMEDGGYRRRELWTAAGWEWREQEQVDAPLYWEPDGDGGWLDRSFDRREPVEPERVLCHVSAHEADAHAAWAGARLPDGGRVGARGPGRTGRPGGGEPRPARVRARRARRLPGGPERVPRHARRRLGVDVDAPSRATRASAPSRTPSTPRSSSGRATGCCAAARGPPSRSPRGSSSATGTCPSGARSSRGCGWRGTPRERPEASAARSPPRRRRRVRSGVELLPRPFRLDVHPRGAGRGLADDALAGLAASPKCAAAQALLRRARLRALRAHHAAARVLPEPHRAADPAPRRRRRRRPPRCRRAGGAGLGGVAQDRAPCSTRCATRGRSSATCPSTSAPRRSSPRRPAPGRGLPRARAPRGRGRLLAPPPGGAAAGAPRRAPGRLPRRDDRQPRAGASATPFLRSVAGLMDDDDLLLVGTDLAGDADRIRAAYDDAEGVTAAVQPQPAARAEPRARRRLRPRRLRARRRSTTRGRRGSRCACAPARRQLVRLAALGMEVGFADGEEMRTEISCKFTRASVAEMYAEAGLRLLEWHEDPRGWFAVSLARRA